MRSRIAFLINSILAKKSNESMNLVDRYCSIYIYIHEKIE